MAKQQALKAAASTEGQSQKASKGYTVLSPFRDIANWDKAYEPGDDVSHFDKERLDTLVKNGLVQAPKGSKTTAAPTSPGGDEGDIGGETDGDPNEEGGDNLD